MNQIIAFFQLNMKLLIKDKISLIWSITLPSVMLLLNVNNIKNNIDQLVFWWVYIVGTSFLFGIGIYALQLKEGGTLRVVFSVKNSPLFFFGGLFATQIGFSLICLIIFNIIASVLLQYNFLAAMLRSLLVIIYCLPIVFAGYNLTRIRGIHANSISTISNIIIFVLFIAVGNNPFFDSINPIFIISNTILYGSFKNNLIYAFFSILVILVSFPSIIHFKCISNERR